MSLEEIAAQYRRALPEGQFYHFPITAMDHTGVCAWSNVFLPGPLGGGDGYGTSDVEAEIGALGELHERLQSLWVVPTLEREAGTYDDLVAAHGKAHVIDPLTLGLPAGCSYTHQMKRLWVRMKRYPVGEVYAPLEAAASSPAELPGAYVPLFLPVSNGLGAGLDESRALCHGVLELLQRDGNSVTYRALDQGRTVDLAGLPNDVSAILGRLQEAGLTVNVKLAATDFGLVNLYVNGHGVEGYSLKGSGGRNDRTGKNGAGNDRAGHDVPQVKLAAGGEACDLDRTAALRKALLEFAFSRARLAFSHGPLADVAAIAPAGYLETHRSYFRPEAEEARALNAMSRWLELSPAELRSRLAPIYSTRESVAWNDLPESPVLASAEPGVRLAEIAGRLRGFDILYLDLATPRAKDHGVVAVKAVVPGLEVETASYGRLGERNLRRLLERGDPLVGLGAPPPNAERIPLSEASEAALGQSAWFHMQRLEERVGSLYCLYREPSRHAVRYARDAA